MSGILTLVYPRFRDHKLQPLFLKCAKIGLSYLLSFYKRRKNVLAEHICYYLYLTSFWGTVTLPKHLGIWGPQAENAVEDNPLSPCIEYNFEQQVII